MLPPPPSEPERPLLLSDSEVELGEPVPQRGRVGQAGKKGALSLASGEKGDIAETLSLEPDDIAKTLSLEPDCYSIVLVLTCRCWMVLAVELPLLAIIFQGTFLYLVALDHTNVFQEGRWLQPRSSHWYVDLLKVLSVLVGLFKIYKELQASMSLYVALRFGKFPDETRRCMGWFWFHVQYVVTLAVLVCAISLVLAARSATTCIAKSLAVGLVVDLDNMLATAIVTMTNIEFKVPADKHLEPPKEAVGQRNKLFEGKFVKWAFFMGFPLFIALTEISLAVGFDTLPLTGVRRGFVSNEFPPELRGDIASCCSPALVPLDSEHKNPKIRNYNVLFFSRIEQPTHEEPFLHWVALEAQPEPTPPSSYQVMLGQDGDGNPGHDSGVVRGEGVQAKYWLKEHGYNHVQSTYDALVEDLGLHQRVSPVAASIQVQKLAPHGHAYRIYVAAQNKKTLALSPEPLGSAVFITSGCPLNCEECETFKQCDKCTEGYYLHLKSCVKCTDHCAGCSESFKQLDDTWAAAKGVPCDHGQCEAGYGMGNNGDCFNCDVPRCATCERYETTQPHCTKCESRYGLRVDRTHVATEYTCEACQDHWDNCLDCDLATGCTKCDAGFGRRIDWNSTFGEIFEGNFTAEELIMANAVNLTFGEFFEEQLIMANAMNLTFSELFVKQLIMANAVNLTFECGECEEGCDDCTDSRNCTTCKEGHVNTQGKCRQCHAHCKNCTIGGQDQCDECHKGYGLNHNNHNMCTKCKDDSCLRCDNVECSKCKEGYGLNIDNTSCLSCGAHCTQCDRSGECAVCANGYAVKAVKAEGKDGTKKSCWPCGDGCRSCSKPGECDTCLAGYKKGPTDGSCYSANEMEMFKLGV